MSRSGRLSTFSVRRMGKVGADRDPLFQKRAQRFRGNVEMHHNTGLHRGEINFSNVMVQPQRWLVNQTAAVGVDKITPGLRRRKVFLLFYMLGVMIIVSNKGLL